MKCSISTVAAGILFAGAAVADGHRSPAPTDARAYIVSPSGGSTVSNPVTIIFGLEGMGVAQAGTKMDNTGHHHLLINTDSSSSDLDSGLPATDQVVHFGGGQTQKNSRDACGHVYATVASWRLEPRAAQSAWALLHKSFEGFTV